MDKNLINDISTYSAIRSQNIARVARLARNVIGSYIYEAYKSDDNIVDIDIGVGTLAIEAVPGELRYKFIPSRDFEKEIKRALKDGTNPLLKQAENKLEDKVLRAYKEML